MSAFTASVELAGGLRASIRDGELMIYENGDSGWSEKIDHSTVQRLEHLLACCRIEHGAHACPR